MTDFVDFFYAYHVAFADKLPYQLLFMFNERYSKWTEDKFEEEMLCFRNASCNVSYYKFSVK